MAEHLSRRLVAKCLPWPLIQVSRDRVELGLGVALDVDALGQVLPEQAVRILVAAALPGKGRPGQGPRVLQIPLLKLARADLAQLKRQGKFAISTSAGKKSIGVRTLAGWARDVVGGTIDGFQLKRIRCCVETLLAAAGVS